jgi:hypothetical protein
MGGILFMGTRKQHFLNDFYDRDYTNVIVVAIKLPTGGIEIITNATLIDTKMSYYDASYSDDLKLKANPEVEIIDWMFV